MSTVRPRSPERLLLAHPNQRWHKDDFYSVCQHHPMTLCLLGAMVGDLVEVKIVDANLEDLSEVDFECRVAEFDPDVVGISVLTSEYGSTLHTTARIAKRAAPDSVLIAGGVHVTTCYESVMRDPNIDFACRGEGEYVLRDLLRHLRAGSPLPVEGLVYREKGHVVAQPRALVDDLTTLPRPDYELVNFERYIHQQPRQGANRHPQLPGTHIHVTRGCPCRCSFCQVEHISGKAVRWRDPTDVVDELQFMKDRYGIRSFTFEDDNTFLVADKAKALLRELIDRDLGLTWRCGALALFALDEEMVDLMRRAGCVSVCVSVESGNPRVLKELVRKPIRELDAVPSQIALLKTRGIRVKASFVIGFPGETWDEIRDTIRFAEHCNADYVVFFNAVALPGTPLHEEAVRMGVLEGDAAEFGVDWRHSKILSQEWTTRDVSILRAYEWDRINFAPDRVEAVAEIWGCKAEELAEIRKKTRDALEF